MKKPAVTRHDFPDHLRINTAVETYKCSDCSKVCEVFDLLKSQTGGNYTNVVDVAKA